MSSNIYWQKLGNGRNGYEVSSTIFHSMPSTIYLPNRTGQALMRSILEFQERIQSRTSQYTRHAQKSSITEKDETSLLKVQADITKIAVLADEKVELAKRIRFLILKARGRLQYDLQRIQNPPEAKAEESILVYSGSSRTPIQPVIETLKSSLSAPSPVAEVPAVVVAAPSPSPAPQPREGARESKRMLS